ncbi:MAG: heparinase II/III family protein [Hyphomicrobiaceae bacterium]
MSASKLGERLTIVQHAARWSVATVKGRLATAPGLAWRLVSARAETFLFVPSDLRPTDPSLADELAAGQMGLGGAMINLGGASPFSINAPNRAWARALHGFAWLGSLRAAEDAFALDMARRLVADWCRRNRSRPGSRGVAAEPAVIARRVSSFIVNAGFLLEDAEPEFYHLFTRTLGSELRALDRASRRATPGYPSLACAMSLTLACLAADGHGGDLPHAEVRLLGELRQQILPDGGHISRNAEIVLEALLDLLPIKQCYMARQMTVPPELVGTIGRMLEHVRAMTTAPGTLARFNGVGAAQVEAVATVLALGTVHTPPPTSDAGPSGYARLQCGDTTVIVDCGRAPPLLHSGLAHAGALSFEMAHAGASIIVNAGAPPPIHGRAAADARATASHSTLVLDEQSSARLIRSSHIERWAGGPGLIGPDSVVAGLLEIDGEARLVAQHNGYLSRFGLIHERRLTLDPSGLILEGVDVLRPPSGTLRLPRDVPVALHFHLPAGARWSAQGQDALLIDSASGPVWRFTVSGARVSLEAATHYAQSQGPSPTRKIVARTATPGETTINWRLELVREPETIHR